MRQWLKEQAKKAPDRIYQLLAKILPRRLVYWCAIRVFVHDNFHRDPTMYVGDIRCMDALNSWQKCPICAMWYRKKS
jgi:hypothetical protein